MSARRYVYLEGVIDLHVHSAPDIRPRSLDDFGLVNEAKRVGVRAVVIKSHFVPTMDRAKLASMYCPEVAAFGGVTLNPSVGGINPRAVEAAVKLGAKIIWLPTLFSPSQRVRAGKNDGITPVVDGKVVPAFVEILKLIARENVILATGHMSPKEIFVIVEEARKQGVEKILVNHPEHRVVDLAITDQIILAKDYGVYFERCYAQPAGGGGYAKNLAANFAAIAKVGFASTIIATDGGQPENPPWSEALSEYICFLEQRGVPKGHLDIMTKCNPKKLLNLTT